MVVAQFYRERRLRSLCVSVFRLLFRYKIGNHRTGADSHVFRLYHVDGAYVLATDGYNWLFRRVRVYQKDIRSCQDRLVKINSNSSSNV